MSEKEKQLNKPEPHSMVIRKDGKVLEGCMDPIEHEIAL